MIYQPAEQNAERILTSCHSNRKSSSIDNDNDNDNSYNVNYDTIRNNK